MEFTTADIIASIGEAELKGPEHMITYRRVCTDTRGDCHGALFAAIEGERFDGNAFIRAAADSGAAGALIGPSSAGVPVPQSLQSFRVADTVEALQRLAACMRKRCKGLRVVALTGSNGKTTTKELTASVLAQKFKVQATAGNFNNHIGVPLTLLDVQKETEVLVAEIGANHPGEVRSLARLAKPGISVITNIAPVHLEGFGSIEGVLRAKLELFEETAEHGCCIYNGDDPGMRAVVGMKASSRTSSFGLGPGNDVSGTDVSLDSQARPSFLLDGKTRISLSIPGRFNVLNALAAAAVGRVMGVADIEIKAGLEAGRTIRMRMELRRIGGTLVLNDSYNANPTSMREAVETLETIEHHGPRIAVLGVMLELGEQAEELHMDLARFMAGRKLDTVIMACRYAEAMKEAYLSAGGDKDRIFTCPDAVAAWDILKKMLSRGELLLLKGSRGARLERIVEKMEEEVA